MSKSETMELYNKIGTQEKRAVNRLLRAMAGGKVDKAKLTRVCRSISKIAAKDEPPRLISGYILYYKQNYETERQKAPTAGLGEIAKVIAKQWRTLPQAKRDELNVIARTNGISKS